MQFRMPGLPFRLEMNRLMVAGSVVFLLGVGGYGAGVLGAWPPDSPLENVFFGITLAGMALYLLGRIVHIVDHLRNREPE